MKTISTRFVVNLDQVSVRNESLDGIDYLVVPGVGMVEGVHTANAGPVFYGKEEIAAYGPEFNSKPAVVYHPKSQDGTFLDACTPSVLQTYGVGTIYNSRGDDGKLKMEFWLNKTKLQKVDSRVYDKVLANEKVEVSIGLTADLDTTPGEWNGEKYAARALNWRPNHVAILPDQEGACSIKKGAGLLANELPASIGNEASLNETVSMVRAALYDRMQKPGYYWDGYVEDVYPSYLVYCTGYADLYKQDYTIKDGEVVFSGNPVAVERVVSYQTADGTRIGNSSGVFLSNVEVLMKTKKEKVDWLVANSGGDYVEDDRKGLMEFGDKRLDDIVAKAQLANEAKDAEAKRVAAEDKAKKDKEAADAAKTVVANTVQTTPAVPSTADYIKSLPPAVQAVINNALAVQAARKTELVANILKSPTNKFTKEWLTAQDDLAMLEGMAALATPAAGTTVLNAAPPMFYGQNTAIPVLNNTGVPDSEKPLPRLTVDDVPDRRKGVLANGTAKK